MSSNANEKKPVYLKDYRPSDFLIDHTYLTFKLDPLKTVVINKMQLKINPKAQNKNPELVFNGEHQKLLSVKLNGEKLLPVNYQVSSLDLKILSLPKETTFEVEIESEICPEKNKTLDGLYISGDIFCTQNEPHGMRRITYFIDRPDILSTFKTKLIADKKKYPVLLSNGNLREQGNSPSEQHFAVWENPYPMPCYLFALVAGNLSLLEDSYKTISGKDVCLRIFTDPGKDKRASLAMKSLKSAMRWDEEVYGLEYDLDIYMIVAVDSFNMGAMENKGLNIFNSSCVLADLESATDFDYLRILAIVAHEYFHNWTGNRVTCRDWFQLTLKEGLTVFRDQQFSMDMTSQGSKRLEDIIMIKNMQFAEDQGPLRHSIRPQSYVEMNNFYSRTVYEKGAEVIRMIHTFLGSKTFRKGMDTYFQLFDGQAVTTEDFVYAMEKASGRDFTQFKRWYDQVGTLQLIAESKWDADNKTFRLCLTQKDTVFNQGVNGLSLEFPMHISLWDADSTLLAEEVLHVHQLSQTFEFKLKTEHTPILALNHHFSAPLEIHYDRPLKEIIFLAENHPNLYIRWEALRSLYKTYLDEINSDQIKQRQYQILTVFKKILHSNMETYDKSLILSFPHYRDFLNSYNEGFDPISVNQKLKQLWSYLSTELKSNWIELYHAHKSDLSSLDLKDIANRAIQAVALSYFYKEKEGVEILERNINCLSNMTVLSNAIKLGSKIESSPKLKQGLDQFYQNWKQDKSVLCKWIGAISLKDSESVFEDMNKVLKDPAFDLSVPNMARALFANFARLNPQFHSELGYKYIRKKIEEIDTINPQMAAGLTTCFEIVPKLKGSYKQMAQNQLLELKKNTKLSSNTLELLEKIIQA